MNGFEGSFLGHSDRIAPSAALECGVCWWVYDPASGDESAQIPAGTAFADLPADWRCPGCDNAREQFMVLGVQGTTERARQTPVADAGRDWVRQYERELYNAYSEIDARMRLLPVHNHKLDIRVVGLRRWTEGLLGIVVTPWCMNIVVVWPAEVWPAEVWPAAAPQARAPQRLEGTSRELAFPSGTYSFISGQLPGIGAVETCSLFSPMAEFDDPGVAHSVAEHALAGLFESPAHADGAAGLSRRRFLGGGSHGPDHARA